MSNNIVTSKSVSKRDRRVSTILKKDVKMSEDEMNRYGLRTIIFDYCLNASPHGLLGIVRSGSLYNRVFWLISFIIFTTVMGYFVVNAIIAYFGYPTNININVVNESPQYFPAFSLCNSSPLRMDKFIKSFLEYTNSLNLTNTNDTTTLSKTQVGYIWNFIVETLNANQTVGGFFYSLSPMLYSCIYNGVICSTSDFIPFISAVYGFCYTFNAKLKNSSNIRYGNEYGGNGELDLSLYVYSNQYVPYTAEGSGMVVLVHDNTEVPAIESAGIYLAPGGKYKLGYRKKTFSFLSSPYTTCSNKISVQMQKMLDSFNGADYGYDEVICYQLCEQTYEYEQCGCVNPNLWNARSIVLPDTNEIIYAPLCYSNNTCYQTAQIDLWNSDSLFNKYCGDCVGECSITDFLIDTSFLKTPLQWQLDNIKQFVENSSIPLPVNWSTTWTKHIYQNYLQVSVVCETTIVENYTQIATLHLVDLLSNIGGQTSLWIGMSFLSLMELIEMLYRLLQYQFYIIKKKETRQIIP